MFPQKARKRLNLEENSILKKCDYIIAHNKKMVDYLNRVLGINENKLISLEIFDYLIPDFDKKFDSTKIQKRIQQLLQALYDYIKQNMYTIYQKMLILIFMESDTKENQRIILNIFGSFMPDDLPFAMQGSFGLVWDGESADTCSGIYGEYLKSIILIKLHYIWHLEFQL